jgi:hypothetical protein
VYFARRETLLIAYKRCTRNLASTALRGICSDDCSLARSLARSLSLSLSLSLEQVRFMVIVLLST